MLAVLLSLTSLLAHAEETGTSGLKLHAWASGGYTHTLEAPEEAGFFLGIARLQARSDHSWHRGGRDQQLEMLLQVEAASGSVELLDARLDYHPVPGVRLRAGRFKAPVSAEYLIPATKMLMIERAMLVTLAPRRLQGVELSLQPGALGAEFALFEEEAGLLGVSELHYTAGPARFHAAVGQNFGEDGDTRIDGAVMVHEHGWDGLIEGIARVNDGAVYATAGFASLGRRIGDPATDEDAFAVEPLIAGDLLQEDESLSWAGTGAVDVFWDGWHLVQTFSYTYTDHNGVPEQIVATQLRGGF